jgi:hypothetical protein
MHHGVSVSGMESIIRIGSIMHGTDYWQAGRTMEKLGLGTLSAAELVEYVNEGVAK